MDTLNLLLSDYTRVLKINTADGTFEQIKVNDDEKVPYTGINQWIIEFANGNSLYPVDKKKFLEFASLRTIKEKLEKANKTSCAYRKIDKDGNIRWMKMTCQYINKIDILLTVRDITVSTTDVFPSDERNYIKEFSNMEKSHVAIGLAVLEFNINQEKEIIEIIKKYYQTSHEEVFKYDDNHYIFYTLDRHYSECFLLLAQFYENFANLDTSIGFVWEDEDWNFDSLFAKAMANLRINKE